MTILGAYTPAREAGNGSKVAFDFGFKIFSASDLSVGKILKSTEVKTTLTLGVDYTVAINAVTDGGTVTYTVAPTALQDSWIGRSMALTQEQDIPTNGPFREVQVENGLDKAMMILQEQADAIGRSVKLPDVSTGVTPVLPAPVDGYTLVWDGVLGAMKNVLIDVTAVAASVSAAAGSAAAALVSQLAAAASAAAALVSQLAAAASANAAAASAASIGVTEWTDYSAASTIVGWASFTKKDLYTKRVGSLGFVNFYIDGVSNATTVSMTLPFTVKATSFVRSCAYVSDAGTPVATGGLIAINGNEAIFSVGKDMTSAAFTASGNKVCIGQFFGEVA